MSRTNGPIPVILISFLNPEIGRVLQELRKSLKIEVTIIVVNNSGFFAGMKEIYDSACKANGATVFHCRNRWLLSLNKKAIQKILSDHKYFMITDDDMDFLNIEFRREVYPCWATELLHIIQGHPSIGKLGIAIQSRNKDVQETIEYRKRNRAKLLDGSGIISEEPVDTTLAIYRSGLYIPGCNRFSPRHNKLLLDGLNSCTLLTISSVSLSNERLGGHYESKDYLMSRAFCFAMTGAWLSSDNYKKTPVAARIFYRIVRPIAWGLSVVIAVGRIARWKIRKRARSPLTLQS